MSPQKKRHKIQLVNCQSLGRFVESYLSKCREPFVKDLHISNSLVELVPFALSSQRRHYRGHFSHVCLVSDWPHVPEFNPSSARTNF